jgi:intracellular multiplication protein IcmK
MLKKRFFASLFFGFFHVATQAAPVQPPSPNPDQTGSTQVVQPKSGLGKQVDPKTAQAQAQPEVIIPKANDVVEESIRYIEDTQLNDTQYDRLKQLYLRRERQKAYPYINPAQPVTRTHVVDLEPGKKPPAIRLSMGFPSSIVFSDMNGNPWFIESVAMSRQAFTDGKDAGGGSGAAGGGKEPPTNVLTIEPLQAAAYGGARVKLRGLSTPVVLILTSDQKEIDARVDMKVPGHNPDADDDITYTDMPTIDISLQAFLDGTPPKDAKRMRTSGLNGTEAWLYKNNLYVRTRAAAQYPAYMASARSTTGVAAFRFDGTVNNIVLTANGKATTVFIEE